MCHYENAPWKESGPNVGHYNECIPGMLVAIFPVVSISHACSSSSSWGTSTIKIEQIIPFPFDSIYVHVTMAAVTATQSFSILLPAVCVRGPQNTITTRIKIDSFVSLAGTTFHRFVANRAHHRGSLWQLSSGLAILIPHWIPSSMPTSIENSDTRSSAHWRYDINWKPYQMK